MIYNPRVRCITHYTRPDVGNFSVHGPKCKLSKFRGGNRVADDAIAEESLYLERGGDIKGPPSAVGIYCCNVALVDEEFLDGTFVP